MNKLVKDRKKNVMIVEDEMVIAMEIQDRLNSYGYKVPACVITGEESIQKAAELQPDLVLMDIVLKGKVDGIEAANYIISKLNIPVIYITANADNVTVERAKTTTPYGFLIKPIQGKELLTTIVLALYKHKIDSEMRLAKEKAENTLEEVKTIRGIVPICCYCKKIKDENNDWNKLEKYISERSYARFSHGICPDCKDKPFKY